MIVLNVPKLTPDRRILWVRVTVDAGAVACKDADIKREVEALKPVGGPPTDDPEPDWTLGELCRVWMNARVIERTANGTPDAGQGVLC